MALGLIKRALPRGLYGRAALILIVPVVGLQLVVSVVFLQRHYEGVTEQMTRSITLDLNLVVDHLQDGGLEAGRAVAEPLGITLSPAEAPGFTARRDSRRLFYDLSGRVLILTLREGVEAVTWVDLFRNRTDHVVYVGLELADGTAVNASFSRRLVSASNPHQLLVLMVFCGVLMTAVAYIFLRNQLRPIRRLSRAAEAFGKGQVVAYHPSGALEVRSAGFAFLDMRSRIERAIEERTRMLSGVSHDLRTPLTRMRLALSMQEENAEIEGLTRDVAEMERLVDTFLDFARDDAQEEPVKLDPVALALSVVEDAARGGGRVQFVGPKRGAKMPLREADLRRALSNLISNALRYGTNAQVHVAQTHRSVRITVEDDGPGIPAPDRAHAVEPFTRLDASRNQDKGPGVGLGLAIVSDVARHHGGVLRLGESEDLGGLRADLVLPR